MAKNKDKPKKRKPANFGQIVSWLKRAGHPVSVTDLVQIKDDLKKLHKAEK